MSNDDTSAVDALIDEVMEGREAAEQAKAPPVVDLPDENLEAEVKGPGLGFQNDPDDSTDAAPPAAPGGDLESVQAERDSYLADSQRLAADFANFRKQSEKRVADAAAAQSAGLVRDLLPVLDACDSALIQDAESAAGPIRSALLGELEKNGLELLAPVEGDPFDPEQHEAVMHEPATGDSDGPAVAEVLRAGYLWKGRVVRPAMVKVIG